MNYKRSLLKLKIILFAFFFIFFIQPSNVFADGIKDLTKEWVIQSNADGAINRGMFYDSLPKSIQKVILKPKLFKDYKHGISYDVGQCTWYVWNRASLMGIDFGYYEGNGNNWGNQGTGSLNSKNVLPRTALSTSSFGSDSRYGHVMFIEYVDAKGNVLISEGNVSQYYSSGKNEASFMIITKERLDRELANGTTHVAEPINRARIENYGKNPDGSDVGTGGEDTDSEEGTSNKTESDDSKYVGEDAWKNKIVNFKNNVYTSSFKGLSTGSDGFINSAFISGLNKLSDKTLNIAYIVMMVFTTGLFLFMGLMTMVYLVILPNGLGGYKLANLFEKTTGLSSSVSQRTTIDMISRLLLTTVLVAMLYANALPVIISGFLKIIISFMSIFI